MFDLCREFPNKTYRELEIYRDADRQEEAQQIITQQENEGLKEDQDKKAIDWKARSDYLQSEFDRVKRENNDLHNKVAALLEAVDPAERIKKTRESGL